MMVSASVISGASGGVRSLSFLREEWEEPNDTISVSCHGSGLVAHPCLLTLRLSLPGALQREETPVYSQLQQQS
jgi:hypothetical protein